MSSLPNQSRLVNDILQLAATNPAFRRRLLVEPAAAIRDAFGVQVPEGFRLKFIERDEDADALVVLPDAAEERQDDQLSDDELEDVAGGVEERGGWAL